MIYNFVVKHIIFKKNESFKYNNTILMTNDNVK